jgi:hypothetical protein
MAQEVRNLEKILRDRFLIDTTQVQSLHLGFNELV